MTTSIDEHEHYATLGDLLACDECGVNAFELLTDAEARLRKAEEREAALREAVSELAIECHARDCQAWGSMKLFVECSTPRCAQARRALTQEEPV